MHARCASLPIQAYFIKGACRTAETNIKKCLPSEIGSGNCGIVRRSRNNAGRVKLKSMHGQSRRQNRRSVEFSADEGTEISAYARIAVPAGNQYSAVIEQRGGVACSSLGHVADWGETARRRIVRFGAGCGTGKNRSSVVALLGLAASNQNGAIAKQGRCMVISNSCHVAGRAELSSYGIIDLR